MLVEKLLKLTLTDRLALIAGLLLGIGVLLLIRAFQVWRNREMLGYSTYGADVLRRRLLYWAGGAAAATLIVGGVYLWQVGRGEGSSTSALVVLEAEPLPNTRLLIPRLGVDTQIIEAPFVARQWDISLLRDEVAHLEGTSYPGQPGNVALAGHITIPGAGWGPFRDLHTLQSGDRIFIEQGDQTFTYEVVDNRVVGPRDVRVVFPTGDDRLTLITCSEWDEALEIYARRIVIVAHLLP